MFRKEPHISQCLHPNVTGTVVVVVIDDSNSSQQTRESFKEEFYETFGIIRDSLWAGGACLLIHSVRAGNRLRPGAPPRPRLEVRPIRKLSRCTGRATRSRRVALEPQRLSKRQLALARTSEQSTTV